MKELKIEILKEEYEGIRIPMSLYEQYMSCSAKRILSQCVWNWFIQQDCQVSVESIQRVFEKSTWTDSMTHVVTEKELIIECSKTGSWVYVNVARVVPIFNEVED